jgi:hypothetical protein
MTRPNLTPYWTAAAVLGAVVVVILLIAALSGSSLKVKSGIIDVERHPATAQREPPPSP